MLYPLSYEGLGRVRPILEGTGWRWLGRHVVPRRGQGRDGRWSAGGAYGRVIVTHRVLGAVWATRVTATRTAVRCGT